MKENNSRVIYEIMKILILTKNRYTKEIQFDLINILQIIILGILQLIQYNLRIDQIKRIVQFSQYNYLGTNSILKIGIYSTKQEKLYIALLSKKDLVQAFIPRTIPEVYKKYK